MTKTSPNDASGVVWALSEFVLFFLRVFLLLTNVYRYYLHIKATGRDKWVVTTKTGPNDASGVVWAFSEFFFLFFCVF